MALNETHTDFYYLTSDDIKSRTIKRGKFSHKGTFGNSLLVAGSYGMTGAAILAARACYASGAGLVTCHVPAGLPNCTDCVPEAVFSIDRSDSIFTEKKISQVTALSEPARDLAQTRQLLMHLRSLQKGSASLQ